MKVVSRHRTRWGARRAAERYAQWLDYQAPTRRSAAHVQVMQAVCVVNGKRQQRHVVVETP